MESEIVIDARKANNPLIHVIRAVRSGYKEFRILYRGDAGTTEMLWGYLRRANYKVIRTLRHNDYLEAKAVRVEPM